MAIHYSKYNCEFEYENKVVIASLLTASFFAVQKDLFDGLRNGDFKAFSEEDIDKMIKVGILSEHDDEIAYYESKRKEYLSQREDNMLGVTVLTTTDCNARCYYCYEHGVKKHFMSIDTAKKIVDYIKNNYKNRPVFLTWFGGEPLFHKSIIDYISNELKNSGIQYASRIISNGYLIGPLVDDAVNVWHLKHIQITLDGIGEEYEKVKNYIDGKKGSFDVLISNIEKLLNNGVKVSIRINFDPRKIEKAKEVIDYLYHRFGNHEKLVVYCAWLNGKGFPSPDDYSINNHPLLELYQYLFDRGYINHPGQVGLYPRVQTCSVFSKEGVVIDPEGNFYKCQHQIIEGKDGSFGNLDEGIVNVNSLKQWQSLEYPYEKCLDCICLPFCRGGCKYYSLHQSTNGVCTPIKNIVKEVCKLYYINKLRGKENG